MSVFLREYGVEARVDFTLYDIDGVDFKVDAVHVAGDTTIMKDEGTEASTTNAFVDEGTGYSILLSATELTAQRVVVYVADQGTKAWLDTGIVVETYGHESAMHDFVMASDLDSPAVIATAVGALTNADSLTWADILTYLGSVLVGNIEGDGTLVRDVGDTKTRITYSVDASNNRSVTGTDAT